MEISVNRSRNPVGYATLIMAKIYTVDASVFLNAFNPAETGHRQSRRLLALLQERATPIIVPTLLLPEVAAAIRRGRDDETLARQFAAALRRLPHLVLVPLDSTLANQAIDVAAQYRLRGSDAVYTAVALRFGSSLVTLDREQKERVLSILSTRYPAEALAEEEQ
jgi:predicted nucleic acid-binding protein